MLMASLRLGKYSDHLQLFSMRQTQTDYSNMCEKSGGAPMGSVLGREECKMYLMGCNISTKWFSWVMRVNRLRMGQDKIQNFSLTEGVLYGLMSLFEYDWNKRGDKKR